jgi:hypothetical protein
MESQMDEIDFSGSTGDSEIPESGAHYDVHAADHHIGPVGEPIGISHHGQPIGSPPHGHSTAHSAGGGASHEEFSGGGEAMHDVMPAQSEIDIAKANWLGQDRYADRANAALDLGSGSADHLAQADISAHPPDTSADSQDLHPHASDRTGAPKSASSMSADDVKSLQDDMQNTSETSGMLTNIAKMRHDTVMGIIGNMR